MIFGIDDADGVFLNHIAVIAVVGEDCKYCCRHRKEPYAARNAGPDAPCEVHAGNAIAIHRERLAQASALIRGRLCPLLPQLFVPCGDWLVGPGRSAWSGRFGARFCSAARFSLRHVDVRLPAGPRRAVYRLVVSARSPVVFPPRDAVLPLAVPLTILMQGLPANTPCASAASA